MVEVFAALVVVEGHRMIVDCGCLQQTMAAGVAWQPSVRHGTASEDGVCGIVIVGRLGWRRVVQLGWAIRCGTSSENVAGDFFDSLTWQRGF